MKVIDILNKIANGEIDINNKYQFTRGDYCTINEVFNRYLIDKENLNLEIIGTKIPEKIDMFDYFTGYDFSRTDKDLLEHLENNFETINKSINEIIDYLKSKGE